MYLCAVTALMVPIAINGFIACWVVPAHARTDNPKGQVLSKNPNEVGRVSSCIYKIIEVAEMKTQNVAFHRTER